ncbi:NAD(P)-dependent oxidoreductase [Paenibacillus sp. XY044]|uniref:NAD-dependent epimerase/dehydratase family protein n=1 Tax=Paenibacillus sp. XY044 TaxID=2026089 RepID=UPI000B97F00F|nr:NAD-dependent epimerase/dehydratase family protein [Paenibacillus sp. XY044]OZB91045.1 nucleoside-diphosphate sugar epimerase [Paenibacillus sp. XY044]
MDARSDFEQRVILITGASGFTGSHACRYFAGQGLQVAAMVRHIREEDQAEGVRYYACDLLDKNGLEKLVGIIAPDYVLHLAGKNSVPESWAEPLLYMESNVLPTLYLLNALRRYPSCRILITGSMLVFPLHPPFRPPHPYGLSKSLQKAAALSWRELFGQAIVLAEPSNLVGPGPSRGFCSLLGQHISAWERGEAAEAFRIPSRFIRRDFLDVRDAIRAYWVLLERGLPGEIYSVRSGKEYTLGEITDLYKEISEKPFPIEWGEGENSSQKSPKNTAPRMKGLGWEPSIPLRTSLTDVLEYFRTCGGDYK